MKKLIHLPGFEAVDDGSGVRIQPGNYLMQCSGCEQAISQTSGEPMIVFNFVGKEGKAKGKPFKLYCSLMESVRWRLKSTLRALGVETPDDASKLDPNDVVGVEVIGNVDDHTYDGNTFSKLMVIFPNEETPKEARPKLSWYEVTDMTEDELEGVVAEYDLDINLFDYNTRRSKARVVTEKLDEAGMLDPPKEAN